jgi:hypothetical protein
LFDRILDRLHKILDTLSSSTPVPEHHDRKNEETKINIPSSGKNFVMAALFIGEVLLHK